MKATRRSHKTVVPVQSHGVFVDVDVVGVMTRSRSRKRPRLTDLTNNSQNIMENNAGKKRAKKAKRSKQIKKVLKPTTSLPTIKTPSMNKEDQMVKIIVQKKVPQHKDIDAKHVKNPLYVTEYVNDMYRYFLSVEHKHMPKVDYMNTIQEDINPQMRSILVDWLVEVAEEYNLLPATLYLCVNLIDRSLSTFRISRKELQLLGCACMLLASKYEEIYSPQVEDFVYVSDHTYTEEQVRDMESKVLNKLGFQLTVPTPKAFLMRFLRAADATVEESLLAQYIGELSLLSYNMLKYRPSVLAASSIYLARYTIRCKELKRTFSSLGLEAAVKCWTATMKHYSGLVLTDLLECVECLHKEHYKAQWSSLKASREKFSGTHKYRAISKVILPIGKEQLPDVNAISAYLKAKE